MLIAWDFKGAGRRHWGVLAGRAAVAGMAVPCIGCSILGALQLRIDLGAYLIRGVAQSGNLGPKSEIVISKM